MKNSILVIMAILMVALVNLVPVFAGPMDLVVMAGAAGLLSVIGIYIGFDFSAIVEGSRKMPKGKFQSASKGKYQAMIFALFIITVECAIVSMVTKSSGSEPAIALYLFSVLGVIAVYVGGMKANKKATAQGE